MNVRVSILLLMISAAAAGQFADAQEHRNDSPALRLHLKAEDLYQNGHFERAYFIYVNELAAIGDKYSQYMAGYMCLNGQGMRQDPVMASAWYRLAAERGAPEFIEVRDQLLESMSEAERALSDEAYVRLRLKYSDVALALGHLQHERREIDSGKTGTRLNTGTGPITVVDPNTGAPMSHDVFIGRIRDRMQVRLDFITENMGIDAVDAGMSDREFQRFADQVTDYLRIVDDR